MSVNRSAVTRIDVPRGLAGVVVTDTEIGDVRGTEGFYHYRQYSAVELARTRGFEDVWHLLVHAALPDAAESTAFAAETAALRELPAGVRAALPAVAAAAAAGGATAAVGETIGKSVEPTTDGDVTKAAAEQPSDVNASLALGVRAETEDKQAKAEEILRSSGALRVWRVGT